MIILSFVLGGLVGIILMGLVSANRIGTANKEMYNAESRAVQHFTKLMNIDRTIKKDENNHEYTIYTIKKIKEILEN